MNQHQQIRSLVIVALFLLMATDLSTGAAMVRAGPSSKTITDVRDVLEQLSDYEFGASRKPLSALRLLVQSSLGSQDSRLEIEKEMCAFLGSDATFAGKQFVCEQLSLIGTREAVPVLTRLLLDEETADIALYALQRIPDPAVDTALRESLSGVPSRVKVAIINTIGERRDALAVAELGSLVYDADSQTALSAVAALGKIADNDAAKTLEAARAKTTGELRGLVLDAYLKCADRLAAEGDSERAASIYRELYDKEDESYVRAAALRGLVVADESKVVRTILSSLKRDNRRLQAVAAGLVGGLPESIDLEILIAEVPNLSPPAQIQLFSAFAGRNEKAAYPAVLGGMKHHDEAVRVAAIGALAKIGSASDIGLLVQVAASGPSAAVREAAQSSLDFLPGPSVDRQIIAQIPHAEPAAKVELVRAIGHRNAAESTSVLLEAARDPERTVRRESLKSLAIVAGPDLIDELIELLIEEEDDRSRNEAERTVVLVSQKIQDTPRQAGPVLDRLPTVEVSEARISLIEVLGRIGNPSALPVIREELKSESPEYQEAAINALSSWPDAGPRDDLLNVVRASDNPTHKILALRGYLDLVRIESDRPARESIELFLTAMDLATESTEKRMVLSGLGELGSDEAVKPVASYLEDLALQREAEAALINLLVRIRREDDETLKDMLDRGLREDLAGILERSNNRELRESAEELLEKGQSD